MGSNVPTTPLPNNQPFYVRKTQDWATSQERMRHTQALFTVGEPVVFVLMWKVEDFLAGLCVKCTRCSPVGGTLASREFAVYEQPITATCPVCYGTTFLGGIRARIVRPAIVTDADEDERKGSRGVTRPESVTVESTNDFRSRQGDWMFRSDGSRWQLGHPSRIMLRTGYQAPTQQQMSIGYARISATREDASSVAYVIPPNPTLVQTLLQTPPGAWPSIVDDVVNGPLIPPTEPQ